jgi:ankyrin repeat protein
LLTAAAAGNLPGVQLLIQKGADSSLTDYRGFTLLHFAALSKNAELVFWLFDNLKINVNAEDNREHTPLYYLQNDPEFDHQGEEIVAILLKKGANPNPPQSRSTLVQ